MTNRTTGQETLANRENDVMPTIHEAAEHGIWDVFVEKRQVRSIEIHDRELRDGFSVCEGGASVLRNQDNQTRFAFMTDLSPTALAQLWEEVGQMGSECEGLIRTPAYDMSVTLSRPNSEFLHQLDETVASEEPNALVRARLTHFSQDVVIASCEGVSSDTRTYGVLVADVTLREESKTATARATLCWPDLETGLDSETVETLGRGLASRTRHKLKEAPFSLDRPRVLFGPEAAGLLIHEVVGHPAEGDRAHVEGTLFGGKWGTAVAPPEVTIVDDPSAGPIQYSVDDEGVAARRSTIIRRGVLEQPIGDRLTARSGPFESSGNGRRQSYEHFVLPRMSNLSLLPGQESAPALASGITSGVHVRRLSGARVNPVSGEVSLIVDDAELISCGRSVGPCALKLLIGDASAILRGIEAIGDDFGSSVNWCHKSGQRAMVSASAPSIVVSSLTAVRN